MSSMTTRAISRMGTSAEALTNFMELSVCFFAFGIPASCNCVQWSSFHFFDLLAHVSSMKRFRGTVYTGWNLSLCGFGDTRLFFSCGTKNDVKYINYKKKIYITSTFSYRFQESRKRYCPFLFTTLCFLCLYQEIRRPDMHFFQDFIMHICDITVGSTLLQFCKYHNDVWKKIKLLIILTSTVTWITFSFTDL